MQITKKNQTESVSRITRAFLLNRAFGTRTGLWRQIRNTPRL
ncbi:hypothetical protein LEP1GSC061_0179 [Leptospira wolffii serovar Khorat str. Khorat-H2]|nr:hypothetical protein LEP1GSC061_0179 [Leptospira wolffii serovar Khorat str. Khorat-H2]